MSQLHQYVKWFILSTFTFSNCVRLSAQQGGGVFYHLTSENGLSSDRANAVIQDREGFYWIATPDGLNRFDGSNCKIFRNNKNDSNSLSHNHCVNLLEDDKGDIWIGTVRGLNRYRKNEGRFERFFFHHPDISFDRVNSCKGLAKDNAGNIWFSSYGLWQFNTRSGTWKQFLHESANPASVPSGILAYLTYDRVNNGLWMSGAESFVFHDLSSGKFYKKTNNPRELTIFKLNSQVLSFAIDSMGNIWSYNEEPKLFRYSLKDNSLQYASYKNSKGIFKLSADNKGRIWTHFWNGGTYIYDSEKNMLDTTWLDYFHPQSALTNNSNNLYIDRTGNYWISSFKGISIFNPEAQAVKYYGINDIKKNYEGAETIITSLAEQNENILWLGTESGVYRFDIKKNELRFMHDIRVHSNLVRSVLLQGDSVLWIGGHAELIRYDIIHNKLLQKIPMPSICWSIKEDEQRNIWAVTWSKGLFQFSPSGNLINTFCKQDDKKHSLSSDHTLSVFADKQPGTLWVGYNGGGGFSRISNRFQNYEHFKIQASSLPSSDFNTVNCMLLDYENNLWMGTYGGGLVFYDPHKKKFSDFTQSDGLKGNFINSILMDDSSRIWISTSNGLNVLDTRNNLIINTDIQLQFPSDDLIPNGLVRKNRKFLFFAGRVIVEIDPYSFLKPPVRSDLLVGTFKIFNEEVSLSAKDGGNKNLRLSHKQNYFSFDYSLLKPNPNAPVEYAYQLEGFDKDWNYVKERRTAYFTNVPAGNYIFRVKAIDNSGKWNYFSDPVFIQIIPPIWKRWWFYAAFVFSIAGLLFILYKYRINQLKKVFSLRTKISQDLHDEVGATLSSIHIYSSVASKAMDKDAVKAKDALQQINENTRQVMENMSDIVWAINADSSGETALAAKLKNYGYDLLTPLNINCIYHIDKEAESKLVNMEARKNVLLIAKEAINNIAKYSMATESSVKLGISGKNLVLEITDNGNGMSSDNNHTGHGMSNMKQRTEIMKGVFQIRSEKNKGTIISCSIPLANISD